jgi:transposase
MHTIHPTPEQLDELQYIRFHHPCPAIQKRAEVVILVCMTSLFYKVIANLMTFHPNTITKIIKAFNEGGIEALTQWDNFSSESELDKYRELMSKTWEENPPATLKQAQKQIEDATGIHRCLNSIRNFLMRMGYRRLMTGGSLIKTDPDIQADFLNSVLQPKLDEAKKGKRHVYFVDASHFVLQSVLGYLWWRFRRVISTGSGRQRYNVLGAVDVFNQRLLTISNTSYVTATTVCELLLKIAQTKGERLVTLVMDNARYQHCNLVIDTADILGIEILFLPAYSPNLNLIERFWKYVKKECLRNKYYEDFTAFTHAIDVCLSNAFTVHSTEMESLLAPNFDIKPKSQSLIA